MFFRTKTSGTRSYLQIVENRWEDGRPRQRVIATLGRLDQLQQTGQLDALLASGARLAQSVLHLSANAKGQITTVTKRQSGPDLNELKRMIPVVVPTSPAFPFIAVIQFRWYVLIDPPIDTR